MNGKEIRDGFEGLFFKEEAGSKDLINEKGALRCRECDEVLMSSKDVKEFIEIARQQWVDEGYWDKNTLHLRDAVMDCPRCRTTHFVTFIVRQYVNLDGFKRYRCGIVGFQDKSRQKEFADIFLSWGSR